jgi:predicted membrane protein
MRMGFLFSEAFWGVFIIIIGVSIVLKSVFGINLPIVKTAFAILLIYAGISMLAGGNKWYFKSDHNISFGNSKIKVDSLQKEYNIIFGSGVIDLTDLPLQEGRNRAKINTIFGSGVIQVHPDIPVVVRGDAVFASARFPDGRNTSFGDFTYRSPQFKEDGKYLEVEADVIFGSLEIVNGRPQAAPQPQSEGNG